MYAKIEHVQPVRMDWTKKCKCINIYMPKVNWKSTSHRKLNHVNLDKFVSINLHLAKNATLFKRPAIQVAYHMRRSLTSFWVVSQIVCLVWRFLFSKANWVSNCNFEPKNNYLVRLSSHLYYIFSFSNLHLPK